MFKGMYIKPEGDVLKDVLVSIILEVIELRLSGTVQCPFRQKVEESWLCGRVFAACVFYAKLSMETRVHGSGERGMVFVGVN